MSLRVWLPLNGTLDNQGLDKVTVTNNGATVDNNGKIGKCYSFGTGNSYITVDSTPLKNFTEFSFACWVKIITWNTSYATIFAIKNSTAVSWNNLIFSLLRNGSNSTLCFNIANGSSYTSTSCQTGTLSTNTWYHVVCTYKANEIKLYLNGNLVSIYTTTVVPNFNSIVNFWIGKSNANSYQSNTLLNDVRIYDHALSSMEVKQISQGLILHYPLNNNGWGQENLLKNTQIERDHVYNSNAILYYYFNVTDKLPTGTYTFSFDIKSDNGTDKCYASYAKGSTTIQRICELANIPLNWTHYIYTFTNNSTECNNVFIAHYTGHGSPYNKNNTGTISVKNVKLELGTKSTPWSPASSDDLYSIIGGNDTMEYDCSGYSNNGIKTGTFIYDSDTPKYNVSTIFNNNYIKNLSFEYTSNIWSISLWYYFETMPSAYQGFICLSKENGVDANKKMALMPNTNKIWFKVENKSGDIASLKTQQWTHIVLTCDGTNGKIYENGILKKTVSGISSTYIDCDDLVIGARSAAANGTSISHYLDGKLSDVRIYCTALSAEDILSLYNNSAYIDNQGNIYGAIYEEV